MRISKVHWTRVFPCLQLLQSASMSYSVRVLVPSYLLLVVSWFVTWQIAGAFSKTEWNRQSAVNTPVLAGFPWRSLPTSSTEFSADSRSVRLFSSDVIMPPWISLGPVHSTVVAIRSLLAATTNDATGDFPRMAWFLILPMNLLLIGFAGTAVARSASRRICLHERCGPIRAAAYALRRWRAILVSTGLACGIVTGFQLATVLAVWTASIPFPGEWIAAICWPGFWLMSVLTVLAAVFCGSGWMLSLAAIGTDECTGSDALSRGINYVLSHKIVTAGYAFGLGLIMFVMKGLVLTVVEAGLSVLGNLDPRLTERKPQITDQISDLPQSSIAAWQTAVHLIPDAVALGVFLSGTTIAYLLLRQKEDGIKLTETSGSGF